MLRKIGAFVLMLAMVWMNFGSIVVNEGTDTEMQSLGGSEWSIVLEFDFPEPNIIKNGRYAEIEIEGLYSHGLPGMPVLPLKTVRVLLPQGYDAKNIEVTTRDEIEIEGSYIIKPGQERYPFSEMKVENIKSPEDIETPPDPEIYSLETPYPTSVYKELFTQKFRGYRILILNLYPVKYIPSEGKLSYYESIKLKIETEYDGRIDEMFRGFERDESRVREMVDNPWTTQTYETKRTLDRATNYEYVIITSEALKNATGNFTFQDLIDCKVAKGLNATIVTVENITSNPAFWNTTNELFNDTQAQIREFIKYAYLNWGTEYVLLGGDGDGGDVGGESGDTIIPHRGFYCPAGGYTDYDIPADLYYACLDGNFNYDNDTVWAESTDGENGGEVDLFAEVYVGRAAVDSPEEVSNFVMKTLAYENSKDPYLETVWMVGEYLGFGGIADYGGNYKDEIMNGSSNHGYTTVGIPDEYNVSTLYDRDYPGNNWPKSEIIGIINNETHIINHLGHANVGYVMKMYNSDVDSLTNEKYFLGYSQGCYDGSFDNRGTSGGYYSYDCISEHLTLTEHGAFAFIGNSRYGWGEWGSTDGPSQHFDREFFDALYGENITNIGRANQDSKEDTVGFLDDNIIRWCYYEITLFGDPEIEVKGAPPHIEHEPLKDTEDTENPYNVTAIITSSEGLNDSALFVYYSTNAMNFTGIAMSPGTHSNEYYALIPAQPSETNVSYYIYAEDINGFKSTHPRNAPNYTHTFHIGPDTVPPVILHTPLKNTTDDEGPYTVTAMITDNLGVNESSVFIYYNTTYSTNFTQVAMSSIGNDEFSGEIPGQSIGTTIYYYIEASDLAGNPNTARAPESGEYLFSIVETLPLLVVDDDDGTNNGGADTDIDGYMTSALDNAGLSYDLYRVNSGDDGPSLDTLLFYDTVIWLTGEDYSYTGLITDVDEANLQAFLSNSRNLWIISELLLWSNGLDSFIDNYLHVESYANLVGTPNPLEGVEGDVITDGMSFPTSMPPGLYDWAGRIEPDNVSVGMFWQNSAHTFYNAIRYGNSSSEYRTILFSFEFGAITELADRIELVEKTLAWFVPSPPTPPTSILPDSTKDATPTIIWNGAFDPNGDELYYYIQIGTTPGGDEILPWTYVGTENSYTLTTPLDLGTYYVQVKVNDSYFDSSVHEETMNITSTNNAPTPPTSILPDLTINTKPNITWEGAYEPDGETLYYYIQIGNSSGGDEILPWTYVGENNFYTLNATLVYDDYYVQVIASDGTDNSTVAEEIMSIVIHRGEYHSYAEMVSDLQIIEENYPDIVKLYDIGDSIEGRDIWAVKVSDNVSVDENESEVLYIGCHHARELISVEVPMYILSYLAGYYGILENITGIVNSREIWIVPMLNPDGHVYVENGNDWRKNRRNNGDGTFGVDLNRNYGYKWGYDNVGSSPYTWSEIYRGNAPFSEPETQAIRDLALEHLFRTMITFHSYGEIIIYPWAYIDADTPDHALFTSIAENMSAYNGYDYGNPNDGIIYNCNGEATDWFYGERNCLAYTIELGTQFAPPEDEIIPISTINLGASLYIAEIAGDVYPDPDMMVTEIDAPSEGEVGKSLYINGTVKNFGFDDQANVRVNLSINGAVEDYIIIPSMPALNSTDVSFNWTPMSDGIFTVGIEVSAPKGDEDISNNEMSTTIEIIASPEAWVSSDSLEVIVQSGFARNVSLTIGNEGYSNLTYEFSNVGDRTIFFDDMEQGMNGWSHSGNNDEWELGSPTYINGPDSAYSGTKCWGTDLDGAYNNYANMRLVSPSINLSSSDNAWLSFYRWYEIENAWDYGYVEISIDGGSTWDTLLSYTGYAKYWEKEEINISSYAGYSDVRIGFRLYSDSYITYSGLYIDDVRLNETVIYDDDWISCTPESGVIVPGSQNEITVTLNATYLTEGDYYSNLNIYTNDRDESYISIPVHLIVVSGNVSIELRQGWNFFSIPVALENNSVESVLSSIQGRYLRAWYYDAFDSSDHWKMYNPSGLPWANDLQEINHTMGVWIKMLTDWNLTVNGTVIYSAEINLKEGWNMLGYPCLSSKSSEDALKSIHGNYYKVWAYLANDTADPWKLYSPYLPPWVSDLTHIAPKFGYWVYATKDTTWTIDS